ncbi:hypothetical protein ACFO0N_08735 [Halobium salinum]|uniref:Uncharacterized protein n=1 Tax=Halobium salinum TaxID=1364940 RepID=A0ABD5PBK7_9EURY|nr:hypothetical protein [Halobium salinum]
MERSPLELLGLLAICYAVVYVSVHYRLFGERPSGTPRWPTDAWRMMGPSDSS